MPSKQSKMIAAWAVMYADELALAWEDCRNGNPPHEDKAVDVVMPNPKWVVNAVEVHADYILRLWFEDGSIKDFDCSKIFNDKPFEPLQDRLFFSRAHVFADTVAWSDEIDIAPEYLYEHGKNIT